MFLRRAGSGPAVLLLHGYPETHVAWAKVAPTLTDDFTVVAADLPGYGDSIGPEPDPAHVRYSKRSIALVLVDLMRQLGFPTFALVGHDRGARVAYRLALDHPEVVTGLAVLDVIPGLAMADRLAYSTARRMANWFWLAQPAPLPETLIGADPEVYLSHIIAQWGGSRVIDADAKAEYVRCFKQPHVVRGTCEDYRAGDTVDLEHDRADRSAGRRITCPVFVLWAEDGLTARFGDPLAIWSEWAATVAGGSMHCGHFMMEETPEQVAAHLSRFLITLR